MRLKNYLNEAKYKHNLGFEEMAEFYQTATEKEIEEMERILKNSNWKEFRKLIQKVLGKKLS